MLMLMCLLGSLMNPKPGQALTLKPGGTQSLPRHPEEDLERFRVEGLGFGV